MSPPDHPTGGPDKPARVPTSFDVARLAGVSQSAVSRTFTPGASVSRETAQKVRRAAEALGYRPNILARSLITGRTRIIGLVVAYLHNQFYPEAIERLSNALQARGYHLLVFTAGNDDDTADETVEELLDYRVDGLIFASTSISNRLALRCRTAGIPVVLFNRHQDDLSLSHVTSDNIAGGSKVADHLVACGHTRIGHIAGWSGSSTGRDRARGFLSRLEAHGIRPVGVIDGMYDRATAAAAARTLVAAGADALFVGNDYMAFAAIDTIRDELGLRVPDDVAVIGYDDVALASWPAYSLTTVRQPARRMVEATVAILIGAIESAEDSPRHVEIDGPLLVRRSTRPLRDHP
jgi:DNA-binding LacI/PurR family transcriptional regulator